MLPLVVSFWGWFLDSDATWEVDAKLAKPRSWHFLWASDLDKVLLLQKICKSDYLPRIDTEFAAVW